MEMMKTNDITSMNWKLTKKKLSEVKPYDKNPRLMTKKGMEDLHKSIDKFGLAEPIVINTDGIIVGGHARFLVLKERGAKEFDCYIPDRKLSDKEVQELNVRLNKNIAGEFDFDILANEFELTDLLEWGFEEKELDMGLWNDIPEEKLDEVPEPQKEAYSKLGDIFLLDGKHRVMCGDSTKEVDVEALMAGIKADMVFTDPPYNVAYSGRGKNNLGTIKNDDMDIGAFGEFLKSFGLAIDRCLKGDCPIYLCHGDTNENAVPFYKVYRDVGWKRSSSIIWEKNVASMGWQHYRGQHEVISYGWKGKKPYFIDDRSKTTIWKLKRDATNSYKHPTQKPVEVSQMAMGNSSKSGDAIIDPFLGSGSTLIACEQTNRICYGMEIDPIYIDVILKRYHNLYPDKTIECSNRKFDFGKLYA